MDKELKEKCENEMRTFLLAQIKNIYKKNTNQFYLGGSGF